MNKVFKTVVAIGISAGLLFSTAVHAKVAGNNPAVTQQSSKLSTKELKQITTVLKKKYPATTFGEIRKAQMGELYEVVMGANIVYVDKKADLMLYGHILDMNKQDDLTQQRLEEINKVDFSKLPLDKAIKVVKGDGSRVFAVFTDPDCPYCKQFEQNIKDMNNITMYVFLFPISELHPNAKGKAEAIWCAKDRAAAWTEFMNNGNLPEQTDKCNAPIGDIAELAASLGVQGTPTLFSEAGYRAPGALPTPALENWLNTSAQAQAAKSAKK